MDETTEEKKVEGEMEATPEVEAPADETTEEVAG